MFCWWKKASFCIWKPHSVSRTDTRTEPGPLRVWIQVLYNQLSLGQVLLHHMQYCIMSDKEVDLWVHFIFRYYLSKSFCSGIKIFGPLKTFTECEPSFRLDKLTIHLNSLLYSMEPWRAADSRGYISEGLLLQATPSMLSFDALLQ